MANRTTATEVKLILDTDLGDPIVEAFISDANPIVTDVLGSDTTLSDAQKAVDVQTLYISYIIVDSEFRKNDADIAERYFDPACRELQDQAIALRCKVSTVRVETEEVGAGVSYNGEPGIKFTVFADLQCPWDREPDLNAWKTK